MDTAEDNTAMDTGLWGELEGASGDNAGPGVDTQTTLDTVTDTGATSSRPTYTCRDLMLNRVAHSDCHFKHQLRGEPDLTVSEKLEIAAAILVKNPVTFLERFGKALHETDLAFFDDAHEQYEIKFYLAEIRKNLDDGKNKQKVRNRRYEAMKKLMDTEYFGDEEMKARNPYLYDQLVGQHLSDEEVKQLANKNETLSQMYMHHLQGMKNTVMYNHFKDQEDAQMMESEDEEEEEETENAEKEINDEDEGEERKSDISVFEKRRLRTELVRAMQKQFLDGEDPFDYSQVDNNTEYDSLDIQNRDAEEKYFDEDEDEVDCMENLQLKAYNESNTAAESGSDTGGAADYETFEVTEDVRPGLGQKEDATSSCVHNNDEEDDVMKDRNNTGEVS